MPAPPLNLTFYNHFGGRTLYAYITGTELSTGRLFLVQADGNTLYYPSSPTSQVGLAQNCSIPVSGSGTNVSVPTNFAGGRIWFCLDTPLTFAINPGPGLVEPSPVNPSDPNAQKFWDFCELTFDYGQLFANISYVDFACLPVALRLVNASGAQQNVLGLRSDGLSSVADQLQAQHNADGAGWDQLIVRNSTGAILRCLSPASAISMNGNLFNGYWQNYVNQVWEKYSSQPLTINTQASYGNVQGQVSNDPNNYQQLVFGNIAYNQPTAQDIFGCNSGPFATNANAENNVIIPRLAAAFNRSSLLESNGSTQPNGVAANQYYPNGVTNNWYSRIMHGTNIDNKGYAFPYDDVAPDGGSDVSGAVQDPNPARLYITVGGGTNAAPA